MCVWGGRVRKGLSRCKVDAKSMQSHAKSRPHFMPWTGASPASWAVPGRPRHRLRPKPCNPACKGRHDEIDVDACHRGQCSGGCQRPDTSVVAAQRHTRRPEDPGRTHTCSTINPHPLHVPFCGSIVIAQARTQRPPIGPQRACGTLVFFLQGRSRQGHPGGAGQPSHVHSLAACSLPRPHLGRSGRWCRRRCLLHRRRGDGGLRPPARRPEGVATDPASVDGWEQAGGPARAPPPRRPKHLGGPPPWRRCVVVVATSCLLLWVPLSGSVAGDL